MDILTWLAEHLELIAWAAPVLGGLALLWFSAHFLLRSEFEKYKLEAKAVNDEQDRRIAAADAARALFEQRLAGLPTSEDMNQVRIALTQAGGDLKALQVQIEGQGEVLKTVKQQYERMNGFLLVHGVK